MFGSEVLEIVISLILIYLLLSMLVTVINEMVSTLFQLRGRELRRAIEKMLNDNAVEGSAKKFYQHPMIKNFTNNIFFFKDLKRKPSYIGSDTFSKVLMDLIRSNGDLDKLASAEKVTGLNIEELIDDLQNSEMKTMLSTIWADSENDIEKFKKGVEDWYNKTMERVSGWYTRRIKSITFIIGLALSIGFNADTFHIVGYLAEHDEGRASIVSLATEMSEQLEGNRLVMQQPEVIDAIKIDTVDESADPSDTTAASGTLPQTDTASTDEKTQEELLKQFNDLKTQTDSLINDIQEIESVTGMGWDENGSSCSCKADDYRECLLIRLLGWLITALALTLGAPFWFDLLKKAVNLRGTGTPISSNGDKNKT